MSQRTAVMREDGRAQGRAASSCRGRCRHRRPDLACGQVVAAGRAGHRRRHRAVRLLRLSSAVPGVHLGRPRRGGQRADRQSLAHGRPDRTLDVCVVGTGACDHRAAPGATGDLTGFVATDLRSAPVNVTATVRDVAGATVCTGDLRWVIHADRRARGSAGASGPWWCAGRSTGRRTPRSGPVWDRGRTAPRR